MAQQTALYQVHHHWTVTVKASTTVGFNFSIIDSVLNSLKPGLRKSMNIQSDYQNSVCPCGEDKSSVGKLRQTEALVCSCSGQLEK